MSGSLPALLPVPLPCTFDRCHWPNTPDPNEWVIIRLTWTLMTTPSFGWGVLEASKHTRQWNCRTIVIRQTAYSQSVSKGGFPGIYPKRNGATDYSHMTNKCNFKSTYPWNSEVCHQLLKGPSLLCLLLVVQRYLFAELPGVWATCTRGARHCAGRSFTTSANNVAWKVEDGTGSLLCKVFQWTHQNISRIVTDGPKFVMSHKLSNVNFYMIVSL